jgi:hypothetical protein
MHDRLMLEIVRTRCASCRRECFALVAPSVKLERGRVFFPLLECPACHTCTLTITSARGLAFRQVTVGVGARVDVPEPAPHELVGARPGRVVTRGPRTRGGR